ncbi:beta-phosphoglucomutase [Vagococcus elongatus]|uniref:Beta-phosphoglucomutase n=1 Tax=Vagococcus elongatus TaxID=180344 RepID=A0A430B4C7_9ENTE|nr:beta-phosphoglucomutase [Vagococcus elongatus]RSU15149.1 beta-phosphoglucomutase [Vagococcus elongatus]
MKGFIFDLDGVITDTAKYHYEAWRNLGEKLGITVDEKFNEQLKGISRMDSLDRILALGNKENEYSLYEKKQLAAEKNAYYLNLLQGLGPDDLLSGVKEFLMAAQERNIPCAIASASKNAPLILEKLDVNDYFEAIVDPASLAKGKPHPEIFIRAAQLIGIEATEAIGFEDAQAGVDGIKACGMFAVGIEVDEPLIGVDISVNSFCDLDIDKLLEIQRNRHTAQ